MLLPVYCVLYYCLLGSRTLPETLWGRVGGTPPRDPPPLLSFLNNLPHRSLLTIKRDHVVESIRKTFGHETLPLGHKIIS